jgi:hypothetical protein
LSIPIQDAKVQQKTKQLVSDITEKSSSIAGFDKSLFISESQLHITILMLKLYNEELKQKAIDLLKKHAATIYDILVN